MKTKTTLVLSILCLMVLGLRAQISVNEEYSFNDVKFLEVSGKFCDIDITGNESNTIQFDGSIEGSNKDDWEIVMDQYGDKLVVTVEKKSSVWNTGSVDGKLIFKVPKSLGLEIGASSGDVRIFGHEGDLLKARASSGDVSLGDIDSDIEIKTSSGDIDLRNVTGAISSRSSSGHQRMKNIKGDIQSVASSGHLTYDDIKGSIVAVTSSGDIEVYGSTGTLDLKASSGDFDGDDITITGDCKFVTTSGDIEMDFTNNFDDLSFDTRSTSGRIRIEGVGSGKDIQTPSAKYEIRGKTTSGNQEYE